MSKEHPHDLRRGKDFIGVNCVFFCHDGNGKVLLHKRSQGCRDEHGTWDCGAGAMEFGESFEEVVRREVKEEYLVDPLDVTYIGSRNVLREHDGSKTHWIANVHLVHVNPEDVAIGEPHKMEEIGWFSLDQFPEPLHSALHHDIEMIMPLLKKRLVDCE